MGKYQMTCEKCGAKMSVHLVKSGRRFSAHCYGCGLHMFGPTPLLERLEHTDIVCRHNPALEPCKRGYTSWCPLCRIRTFAYSVET